MWGRRGVCVWEGVCVCVSVSCRCSWTHQRVGCIDRFWDLMISPYLTGIWRDDYANCKRDCHFVWGWDSGWTRLCMFGLHPFACMHESNNRGHVLQLRLVNYDETTVLTALTVKVGSVTNCLHLKKRKKYLPMCKHASWVTGIIVCVIIQTTDRSPLMFELKWFPWDEIFKGLTLLQKSNTNMEEDIKRWLKSFKPELAKAMAFKVTNSSFSSFIDLYFLTSWRMVLFSSRSPASFDWSSSIM